jgi:hypothetical protein
MRPFALMRRLSKAFRSLFRWVPQVWKRFDVDRLFKYRREYQVPESWQNSRPQLVPLEPRTVPAVLKGEVWYDTNDNTNIDGGESGASGLGVTLSGGDLVSAESTTTDSFGKYTFSSLDSGLTNYTVTFASVTGYTFDNLFGGNTSVFNLLSTDSTQTINAGLYTNSGGGDGGDGGDGSSTGGVIGGTVWYDTNGNHYIETGEPFATGVEVTASSGTFTESVATGIDGTWDMGLLNGTYQLEYGTVGGYGYDTPGYGITTIIVSGGTDTDCSAGLITNPTLEGQAFVAVRGAAYNGVVATLIGNTYGGVDSTIEWGDGDDSPGTYVAVTGSTYYIEGSHTYDRAAYYALGVYAAIDTGEMASAYAEDLVDVLAPTDGLDPQMATVSIATGSISLGVDATATNNDTDRTYFAFTADASSSVTYTFNEQITEPNGTFTIGRTGTFAFSLSEHEHDNYFLQPDSSISVTDTESFSKNQKDGMPTMGGTTTESGSLTYGLTESATGASYTWSQSGSEAQTSTSTETTLSGTYVETDLQSSATAAVGTYDFPDDSLTATWSGSESSVRQVSGYNGQDTYTTSQTDAGALTATETGTLSEYEFSYLQHDVGTYTLSESTTNVGGGSTDSGTGSYSITVNPSDAEPPSGTIVAGGSEAVTDTTSTTFVGSGSSTLDVSPFPIVLPL